MSNLNNGFITCTCNETYWYEDGHPETGLCRFGATNGYTTVVGVKAKYNSVSKEWMFAEDPGNRFPGMSIGDPVPSGL